MIRKKVDGFSLLELMITVAIISILAAIAIPKYKDYMLKTRRAAAEAALGNFANAMERYNTIHNTYLGAAAGGANSGAPDTTVFPSQTPADGTPYYNLEIRPGTTISSYTLRATPIPGGAQDGNGYLELKSTGAKGWDINNDGDTLDTVDGIPESQW